MVQKPIVIERLLNAPIEKVWSAITDNSEMKNWYFKLEDFKPEPGFKFQFTGGKPDGIQYLHLCEVTEVVPGKKITYSWRYDGYPGISFVTWELAEQDEQTLLTLTHNGIETIAVNGPDFAASNFMVGWTAIVGDSLREYLQG